MMQKSKMHFVAKQLFRFARPSPLMMGLAVSAPARFFGHTKYAFADEDWQPNVYQISSFTHKSNAEELINTLPIVEVHGNVTRCAGVQELGLGHPVQYI